MEIKEHEDEETFTLESYNNLTSVVDDDWPMDIEESEWAKNSIIKILQTEELICERDDIAANIISDGGDDDFLVNNRAELTFYKAIGGASYKPR